MFVLYICSMFVYLTEGDRGQWHNPSFFYFFFFFFFFFGSFPHPQTDMKAVDATRKKALASFILSSALHASVFSFFPLLSTTRISASSRLMGQVLRFCVCVHLIVCLSVCVCVCEREFLSTHVPTNLKGEWLEFIAAIETLFLGSVSQ